MTNQDLLLAMSNLLDEKLDEKLETKLEEKLKPIREDISVLKEDVSDLKEDVSDLKTSVRNLDERQKRIELKIEVDILPNLQLLAENYLPAAKRYVESTSRMDKMQNDIEVMKSVLREHSRQLQLIS
jgi:chromosome segregation ATPase